MHRHTSLINWLVRATLMTTTLPILAGCSFMIAKAGVSGLGEIPDGLSRKEVEERFGSPASSSTTSAGRQIEIYNIRQQLDCVANVLSVEKSCIPTQKFKQEMLPCVIFAPLCLPYAMLESINVPINLVRSEMRKLEVAFVYGPDDRVLYFYELKFEPGVRYYGQALRTLTDPLSSETELAKCPSAKECMERYIEEARRRAVEVGHTLILYDEEAFHKGLEIAGNLDERKITKEEAMKLY